MIASGDGIYKLDYNKVLEYHIEKKADITIVCKDMPEGEDVTRFGLVKTNEDGRIVELEEKPMVATSNTVSCGIYIIRRRQLIELIERCAAEDRVDFVRDILVRYKNLKRIYAYKIDSYWSNIASVESYYKTNMDFLKPEVRNYFFKEYPDVYSKVDDLPPAKYNPGAVVKNSLISTLQRIEDERTDVVIIPFTSHTFPEFNGRIAQKDSLIQYISNLSIRKGDTNIADAWAKGVACVDSTKIN